jgi:hypothetical protein
MAQRSERAAVALVHTRRPAVCHCEIRLVLFAMVQRSERAAVALVHTRRPAVCHCEIRLI